MTATATNKTLNTLIAKLSILPYNRNRLILKGQFNEIAGHQPACHQGKNLRFSSLRTSAQSAQIIREIEWNLLDESHGLDAGKVNFPPYFV